jgi:aryl-alcohol dehydrogenase-like predicted oxidoreductase
MNLPTTAYTSLNDSTQISRLIHGMWQVSGTHGSINEHDVIQAMLDYHTSGFTTWDLADSYGSAEDLIGRFRQALAKKEGADALNDVQAFTKWMPRAGRMSPDVVDAAVNLSLKRMGSSALDMLQFHWWDYRDTNYLSALKQLVFLVRKGKIKHLGLTNFDTRTLRNINHNGLKVTSNQVQFSLIDRRAEVEMIPYCAEQGMVVLAYGTLAGGLLTDHYLDQPEPTGDALNTASLRKYKAILDRWGSWELFQTLLGVLRTIADKHGVSIANVATRYVLDKPTVASVIIGAKLGVSDHRGDNVCVFGFALDDADLDAIHAVTEQAADLYQVIGDCGAEYRK